MWSEHGEKCQRCLQSWNLDPQMDTTYLNHSKQSEPMMQAPSTTNLFEEAVAKATKKVEQDIAKGLDSRNVRGDIKSIIREMPAQLTSMDLHDQPVAAAFDTGRWRDAMAYEDVFVLHCGQQSTGPHLDWLRQQGVPLNNLELRCTTAKEKHNNRGGIYSLFAYGPGGKFLTVYVGYTNNLWKRLLEHRREGKADEESRKAIRSMKIYNNIYWTEQTYVLGVRLCSVPEWATEGTKLEQRKAAQEQRATNPGLWQAFAKVCCGSVVVCGHVVCGTIHFPNTSFPHHTQAAAQCRVLEATGIYLLRARVDGCNQTDPITDELGAVVDTDPVAQSQRGKIGGKMAWEVSIAVDGDAGITQCENNPCCVHTTHTMLHHRRFARPMVTRVSSARCGRRSLHVQPMLLGRGRRQALRPR